MPSARTSSLPLYVALIPLSLLIFVTINFAVDVPFMDQWEFIHTLDKAFEGRLEFGDLWKTHNNHRIFFPRIVMVLLARLTHWNIGFEVGTSVAFAAGTFAVLTRLVRRTTSVAGVSGAWLVPVISLFVFSVSQWENFLWGWQLQIPLNVLAIVSGITLLSGTAVWGRRLIGASTLGIVAAYSFGNGVIYWPAAALILPFVLAGRDRRRAFVLWGCVAVITTIGNFYDYAALPWDDHTPRTYLLDHPASFALYVSSYVGNPVAGFAPAVAPVAGIAGVVGLVVTVLLLIRRRILDAASIAPYLALSAYALGSAMLTGFARAGLGTSQALASRYVTVAYLFWLSLVVLLFVLAGSASPNVTSISRRRIRTVSTAAIVMILLGAGLATAKGVPAAKQRHELLMPLYKILRDHSGPHELALLGTIHPTPEAVVDGVAVLEKHGLSACRRR